MEKKGVLGKLLLALLLSGAVTVKVSGADYVVDANEKTEPPKYAALAELAAAEGSALVGGDTVTVTGDATLSGAGLNFEGTGTLVIAGDGVVRIAGALVNGSDTLVLKGLGAGTLTIADSPGGAVYVNGGKLATLKHFKKFCDTRS